MRTSEWRAEAVDLMKEATISALVCERPFVAYGVAGGGQVVELASTDNFVDLAPEGPNPKVRKAHLSTDDVALIQDRISDRFDV